MFTQQTRNFTVRLHSTPVGNIEINTSLFTYPDANKLNEVVMKFRTEGNSTKPLFCVLSDRISMVTYRVLSFACRDWALQGSGDLLLNEHQVIWEGQAMLLHHGLQAVHCHQMVKHLNRGHLVLQREKTHTHTQYAFN